MAKASALGRGLGALLSEIEEAYDNELPKKGGVEEIAVNKIRPNPYQPRKHFDSESLAELLAELTIKGTETILGGGDSIASIHKLNLAHKFTFISTGGGAMLDYLVNENLPALEALGDEQKVESL